MDENPSDSSGYSIGHCSNEIPDYSHFPESMGLLLEIRYHLHSSGNFCTCVLKGQEMQGESIVTM